MRYYFLDLEMLSAPNYVDMSVPIAIGIVSLEGDYSYKSYINPEKKKLKVHEHTISLTGITKEQLVTAPNFSLVHAQLTKEIGWEDVSFVVWGNADKVVWANACEAYNLSNQVHFIDYQKYIKDHMRIRQNLGLQATKNILSIEEEYEVHEPLSDARLLRQIYQLIETNKKAMRFVIRKHCFEKELTQLKNRYPDVYIKMSAEYQDMLTANSYM